MNNLEKETLQQVERKIQNGYFEASDRFLLDDAEKKKAVGALTSV